MILIIKTTYIKAKQGIEIDVYIKKLLFAERIA